MARIVIAGAGILGLGTALLLCRDGHEVTVLERDRDPAPIEPEQAWADWQRRGVNQFRLPHFFLARYRSLVEAELPEVRDALVQAGAVRLNPVLSTPERFRVQREKRTPSTSASQVVGR
jgi:nucleoside-diphosphate-sugar epimerase